MLNVKKLFTKMLTDMKKCEKKTLLWENADPLSAFGAQVIQQADVTNYDACEILGCGCAPIRIPKDHNATDPTYMVVPGWKTYPGYRGVYVNSNKKVSVDVGMAGSGNYLDNTVCTPYKIYGIKGGVLTCLNFITSLLYRERGCCVC